MKISLLFLLIFSTSIFFDSTRTFDLNYFHCRAATCQEFSNGLKNFAEFESNKKLCQRTIESLRTTIDKHGKCLNKDTSSWNVDCVQNLALTVRQCVEQMQGVPLKHRNYFCGHRLMKNCARFLGLEQIELKEDFPHPDESRRSNE